VLSAEAGNIARNYMNDLRQCGVFTAEEILYFGNAEGFCSSAWFSASNLYVIRVEAVVYATR
jgi:hypothetical protein